MCAFINHDNIISCGSGESRFSQNDRQLREAIEIGKLLFRVVPQESDVKLSQKHGLKCWAGYLTTRIMGTTFHYKNSKITYSPLQRTLCGPLYNWKAKYSFGLKIVHFISGSFSFKKELTRTVSEVRKLYREFDVCRDEGENGSLCAAFCNPTIATELFSKQNSCPLVPEMRD